MLIYVCINTQHHFIIVMDSYNLRLKTSVCNFDIVISSTLHVPFFALNIDILLEVPEGN